MAKWCYVLDGVLIDIVEMDPTIIYPDTYAALFESIPDHVDGSYYKNEDGDFVVRPVSETTAPADPRVLTESEFLSYCTRAERQGFTAASSSNADFEDFMNMLEKTGKVDVSSTGGQTDIAAFVTASIISQSSADAILGN